MPPSDPPDERRSAARAPIELRVEYKRLNSFFADYTRNISKGGSFIRTDRALPVGTEFVFCLVVPRMQNPLRLAGKVVWTVGLEEATEEQPPGMGIEFQYRDEEQRKAIESWVTRVMVAELGQEIADSLLGLDKD